MGYVVLAPEAVTHAEEMVIGSILMESYVIPRL